MKICHARFTLLTIVSKTAIMSEKLEISLDNLKSWIKKWSDE